MAAKRIRSIPLVFDYIGFGNMCMASRLELGLNIREVSGMVDVSITTISRYEQAQERNQGIKNILALANLYDLDIRDYFILTDTNLAAPQRKFYQTNKAK